ncbi:MAG: SUMF1/EgtB/PvdO family nonheme iron enzyme [Planctomycetota bacterium]
MKIGHLAAGIVLLGGAAAAGAVFLRDKAALGKARLAGKAASESLAAGDVAAAQSAFGDMWERASRVGRLTGQAPAAQELQAEARDALLDLALLEGPERERLAALDEDGTLLGAPYPEREALEAELWAQSAERALRAEGTAAARDLLARAEKAGAPASRLDPLRAELAARDALLQAEQAAREGRFADAAQLLERAQVEGLELPDAEALGARIAKLETVAKDTAALEAYTQALEALAARVPAELGVLRAEVEALSPPSLRGGHPQALEQERALEALAKRRARLLELSEAFAGMVFVRSLGDRALFVDRAEVTNADFAAFVAAGGYTHDDLWSAQGLALRPRCTDLAGKPGPKGWDGGPPAGAEDEPVRQIGPYEAEAYAAWAAKRLLSFDDWTLAVDGRWRGDYAPGKGNVREAEVGAPTVAGAKDDAPGAVDLCGNVAEIARKNDGFVALGGSYRTPWSEANPARATPLPPTLRGSDVGFRCARELELPWERD